MLTVSEYLNSYRLALENLDELAKDIRSAEAALTTITAGYSDMPGGGDGLDRQRQMQARLGDLQLKFSEQKRNALAKREEIANFIRSLRADGVKQRNSRRAILEYYAGPFESYDSMYSAAMVADIIGCNLRYAQKLLVWGVDMADKPYRKYVRK